MAKSISWLLGTGLLALATSVASFLLVANVRYAAVDRAATEIVDSVTEVTEHSLPLAMAAKDLRYHVVQVQQWLTDVSATRAAEGYADGFDKAREHASRCRDLFARFEGDATVQAADRQRLAELRSAFESYYTVGKTMAQATGREILAELLGHLRFDDIRDEVQRATTTIPVMMPYITSEFERREIADRPPVIPQGAANFALLGQYVEIPEDVVFTVEYSVRGAMHAVYGLLGLGNEIPPIYHGITDPAAALASLRTLMG